jgi:transcriptional regulator with XRE-family HTH domain
MAQFDETKVALFLGVVRKYMQVRGSLTQKDLSELVGVGVSTMSRFLNQRTTDLNPQLIAKIVAKLNIPLHEMIDFVEEGFSDHFIRLVKLYKEEGSSVNEPGLSNEVPIPSGDDGEEDNFAEVLSGDEGTAQRSTSAKIKVAGKSHTVSFNQSGDKAGDSEIKDKLRSLSARQRGFLTDFLSLDTDGKDLVVDIGKNIITYLRQKGIDF